MQKPPHMHISCLHVKWLWKVHKHVPMHTLVICCLDIIQVTSMWNLHFAPHIRYSPHMHILASCAPWYHSKLSHMHGCLTWLWSHVVHHSKSHFACLLVSSTYSLHVHMLTSYACEVTFKGMLKCPLHHAECQFVYTYSPCMHVRWLSKVCWSVPFAMHKVTYHAPEVIMKGT